MRNTLRSEMSNPLPDRPGPPLEARAELFGSVFVLVQHLGRRMDQALAPFGVTTRQWLLLAVLQQAFPGLQPTLSEAAARYGSSRQNVKQIALALRDAGFLELVPDPADARVTRLRVTDRVRLFDEPAAVAAATRFLDAIYAGLTAADVGRLRDLVVAWLRSIEMTRPPGPTKEGAVP
jgi:DNA-binding MarR family transcriptional regulator